MIFIVMGVSGSGKTTIGTLLAQTIEAIFADADDFHPQANKDKMAAGHPLDDADREPWLHILNRMMLGWQAAGKGGVLACSALKASYRSTLSSGLTLGSYRFVLLDLPRAVLEQRLSGRHHEFMNSSLLDSQLETLEVPTEEHDAITVENDRAPDQVVDEILARVQERNGT